MRSLLYRLDYMFVRDVPGLVSVYSQDGVRWHGHGRWNTGQFNRTEGKEVLPVPYTWSVACSGELADIGLEYE